MKEAETERPKLRLERDRDGRLRSLTPVAAWDPEQAHGQKKHRRHFPGSLRFPKLQVPKSVIYSFFARLSKQQKVYVSFGLVVILCVLIALVHFLPTRITDVTAVQGAATANGPVPAQPTFDTLLPANKSVAGLGGWYRISPPDRNAVYAFADHIGSVEVDVSEQPLPENFKDDTATNIDDLAKSFSANQKITVNGVTVYVGTSAKGPQSLILTEHGLLILIKSASLVSNNQWASYINSLQ